MPGTAPPPLPHDLPVPELSENAQVVLRRRYLQRGADGEPAETPQALLWRVAWHVAQAEADEEAGRLAAARTFYRSMARLEFLPASPTLMNAGLGLGQLAACFVLPIDDSLESIFDTLKHAALVHQSGGGTGFDFSAIRPAGDPVRSSQGVASGPLSFLRIYNATTDEIKQGGTRRGANMGVLRVDHPDIVEFIHAKKDPSALTNFNLSVAVTDAFMAAVRDDKEHHLVHPRTGRTVRTVPARVLFQEIAEAAWTTGEPGLLFIDRMNAANPVRHAETIAATNPCGEQSLAPYDSCTLGSIDLARFVHRANGAAAIDWDRLADTVRTAVRFLDDVVTVNKAPVPEIREKTLANRRIGLGVMGFARLLFRLGIPYASEEGRATARRVMAFIQERGHKASEELAAERGVFPNWVGSIWEKEGRRMRNAAVTTIAPTGTIGMIADTSGGCEPEFSLVYVKRCLDGTLLDVTVPELEETARREGFWRETLLDEIAANGGRLGAVKGIPERWRRVFATAQEIAPEDHVRMQAAFQEHVDNAVSKTINLPRDADVEAVERVYLLAHELRLKGITVYRHGTRPAQVLDEQLPRDPPTGTLPEDIPCGACGPPVPQRATPAFT